MTKDEWERREIIRKKLKPIGLIFPDCETEMAFLLSSIDE